MVRRRVACDKRTKVCETRSRKQKGPSPIVIRFFSVIFAKNDSEVLFLPPKFVQKVNLPSQETEIEDSSGSRWSVTLSYINGSLAFEDGWFKFYRDHGLEDGHLLVFNYIKESHFDVQIFRKNCCEVLNFDNVRIQPNRRRRWASEGVSRDEPFQTPGVILRNKRRSSTPVAPLSEPQNQQTCVAVGNADLASKQSPLISSSMDDLSWMVNRDDSQGEDRNILYDLSSFEMEKQTPDADKIASYHSGLPEQAKTSEDDTRTAVMDTDPIDGQSGDLPADKFEKALDTKMAPSHANISKLSKTNEDNSKMKVIQSNKTNGNSGDVFAGKFDKSSTKGAPSPHAEIMEWTETIEDDTQMPATLVNQVTGRSDDIFTDKFHAGSSDYRSLSKGKSIDVSNLQNSENTFTGKDHVMASYSQSPFTGSSKIAERESSVKRKRFGSSVMSLVPEDPSGYRAIKKKRVKLVEKENAFPSGKDPTGVENYDQMFPPMVNVEPDISPEGISSVEVSPFSAEVKNLSYLEFRIPSKPGRKGRRKVVYLKDPNGRLWPLLYVDANTDKALIATWTMFCQQNNIKPGDECRFRVEKEKENNKDHRYIYKVDVARRSGRLSGN